MPPQGSRKELGLDNDQRSADAGTKGWRSTTPLPGQVLNVKELKKIADEKENANFKKYLHVDARRKKKKVGRDRISWSRISGLMVSIASICGSVGRPSKGSRRSRSMAFPSQYCTDHGRAINNFEEGWGDTLTGMARRVYDAYETHLKARGYQDPRPDPEPSGRRVGRGRALYQLVVPRRPQGA